MRRGLASTAAALGVTAVAALCATLPPAWRGLSEAMHDYRAATEADARSDDELKKRAREDDVLNDLAVRAASGALPLAEAADAAVVLLQVRDGFRHNCDVHWKTSTPRLGAARHLVIRTEWLLPHDPDALDRLEDAYRTMDPGPGW